MFVVIYSFQHKKEKEAEFLKLWKEMTIVIRENCGGLGSRLHKASDSEYIAYAQWPSKETFKNAKMPKQFEGLSNQFKSTVFSVKVLHRLQVINDLLI